MTPHALIAPARLAGTCLMQAQSDERLIDLIRAGNERAFEAVVARYSGALLRHCRTFLPDGRAEDALQQTLLRAHTAIVAEVRPLRLKPWLFRIATNASIDLLRQPGWSHEELDAEIDGVDRPDQIFERREQLHSAIAAVQELPARQRDAIVLRELEGRSYEEIAAELGLSGGAVRQLLHRGRAGLRRAASAFTPPWLIERLAWAGEPAAARAVELTAGAGAGMGAAVATVLAAGAIAGGAPLLPIDAGADRDGGAQSAARVAGGSPGPEAPGRLQLAAAGSDHEDGSGSSRGSEHRIGGDDDNRGPGRGEERERSEGRENSGPGRPMRPVGDNRKSRPRSGDQDSGRNRGGDTSEHEESGGQSGRNRGKGGGGSSGSESSGSSEDTPELADESSGNSGSGSSGSGSGSAGDASGSLPDLADEPDIED